MKNDMNELEVEVEDFLRCLEREEGHSFEILPQHHLEGASGKNWRIDFAIKDFDEIKYLVECKNIESLKPQTFLARMDEAYRELCDLLIKLNNGLDNPTVFGIVVVPEISYPFDKEYWCEECDKWGDRFQPINARFCILDMFKDDACGILELIRDI